jgi:peptide/nickel transport system substrate-binding protein
VNSKWNDHVSGGRRSVLRAGAVLAAIGMVAAGCSSSKKSSAAPTAAAGAATATTSPAGSGSGSAPANADTSYVLKSTAEAIHNLDPVHDIDVCNVNSLANIYDMLVRTTQVGKLVPGVAASWSSPDPSTFTMKLQPNVKFQDGTPYDSQAVATAIKRDQSDPTSTLKAATAPIASIDTPDATTVTLHLSKPVAGNMPGIFAGLAGLIPSPTEVAKEGASYGATNAVGAGPYKVSNFVANNSLSMTKWQGYWDPNSQLFGGINFIDMGATTDTLRPAEIQQGTLDVSAIKDSEINLVQGKAGVSYKASPSEQYAEIFVNFGVAPFNNVLVRQALEYAVNRQALVTALTGGLDKVAWQPIPPQDPGYDPSLDNLYPYNPAKAKQLLAQAGFPNGLKISVGEIAFDYYQRLSEAVQQMLNSAGFQVTLVPFAATAVTQTLYQQKKFDIAVTAFLASSPGPGPILSTPFAVDGAYNISGTATPGVDPLLAAAAATTDPAAQAKLYQQVSKIVVDQALNIPLYYNSGVAIYGPKIQNVAAGQTTCAQANFLKTPLVYASK